jgi:hypothetical protein
MRYPRYGRWHQTYTSHFVMKDNTNRDRGLMSIYDILRSINIKKSSLLKNKHHLCQHSQSCRSCPPSLLDPKTSSVIKIKRPITSIDATRPFEKFAALNRMSLYLSFLPIVLKVSVSSAEMGGDSISEVSTGAYCEFILRKR